jgi:DNA-binding HxlR family transcriptional regulator
VVEHNKEIDNKIYTLFTTNNNNKKHYFNQILKSIFPSINPKTNKYERKSQEILRRHLNIMLKQKILERDENPEIGKPRYYWLSEKTKWELKNDIFEGVKSKREGKRRKDKNTLRFKELDQVQKRKIAFRLLISYISRGSFVFNNPKDGQPLDIHYQDVKDKRNKQFYSITMLKGFRISDLLDKNRILADDKQYRYIDLSKQEIENLIELLKNEDPPLIYISGIHTNGELMYDISNKDNMKTFVFHCEDLLFWLKRRIEMKWTYKQHKKEEFSWYCNIYGKDKATDFFTKEKGGRNKNIRDFSETVILSKENKKKKFYDTDNQIQKEIKALEKKIKVEQIQKYDEIIKEKIQWIEQQQKTLKKKYGYVCDFIIKDIYPEFLKQEYKKLYNF